MNKILRLITNILLLLVVVLALTYGHFTENYNMILNGFILLAIIGNQITSIGGNEG